MSKEIALQQIRIKDPFWSGMQEKITDTVIPFQERVLNDKEEGVEKSHALDNFRIAAGLMEGEFYGMVFQDSDVAKWLEGVAYSLVIKPDAALEQRADDIIDIIAKAQQPDGYLNTFFTIKEPEHRWQNLLECHELYCAGHMMEAAVAYYEATGKDKLLGVMERMAQHIMNRFGEDKIPGIPGHQEVEIGLMRMYHATGKEAYKDMDYTPLTQMPQLIWLDLTNNITFDTETCKKLLANDTALKYLKISYTSAAKDAEELDTAHLKEFTAPAP